MTCKRFDLAWITVDNFEQAKTFFVDTLGMKISSEAPEFNWAELQGPEGGAKLGIAQADPNHSPCKAGDNAIATFTVSDIEKSVALFKERGVTLMGDIVEVPGHVKLQFFKDPAGNLFQLAELLS